MERRPIGKTGLQVGAIGFGAGGLGGDLYGPVDDQEAIRAIHRALDLGCTLFDAADLLGGGRVEALLGKALRDLQPAPVVAVHGGAALTYEAMKETCLKSLARLRREAADLFFLSVPPRAFTHAGEIFQSLWRLRAAGLVRFGGVALYRPEDGPAALEGGIDAIQVSYSIMNHTAGRAALLAQCRAAGVGVVAREPLAAGFLAGRTEGSTFGPGDVRADWPPQERQRRGRLAGRLAFLARPDRTPAQSALKFVLANEDVSVAVPGIKSVAQAEENLRTPLAPDLVLSELEQVFETIAGCEE